MPKSYIEKIIEKKQKCRDVLKKEVLICVDLALDIFFENLQRAEENKEFISNKEFLKKEEIIDIMRYN